MNRSHLSKALDEDLMRSRSGSASSFASSNALAGDDRDALAGDVAFAGLSAALIMTCNSALPLIGGVAAAASIPVLARVREVARLRAGGEAKVEDSDLAVTAPKRHVLEAVNYTCAVQNLDAINPRDGSRVDPEAVAAWNAWLPWGRLHAGEHVEVPANLPHPREVGFSFTRLASDVGQVADWVRSLPDGSRLHVHEFASPSGVGEGRLEVHRDAMDPSQGPITATFHWMSETPEGNMLGFVATAAVLFCVWKFADPASG